MNTKKNKMSFVEVNTQRVKNSKGASIFKKILEDKKAIRKHLQSGGSFSEIKDKYNFATPLSIKGN